jgi:hypothetical protein
MSTIDQLEAQILQLVQQSSFNLQDLLTLLAPVGNYINDPVFMENIADIISILTEHRDGSSSFSVDDILLLLQDPTSMMALITSIMLIIGAIPNLKLQYDNQATEEFIFKILAYIFLVMVPQVANITLSNTDKETIIGIVFTIYQTIVSSQLAKTIIQQVATWFQSKGLFTCCTSTESTQATVLQRKMPKVQLDLRKSIQHAREKSAFAKQIEGLKSKN